MKKVGIIGYGRIGKGLVKLFGKKNIEYVLLVRGGRREDLSKCDLIIEAITEDFKKKALLYKSIVPYIKEDTILGTTTSSLSVEKLAKVSGIQQNFVGLHFFNPPHYIEFVELIPAKSLTPTLFKKATDFLSLIGYDYIIVPDTPGFVANKILFNMLLAAVELKLKNNMDEGVIDSVVKKSLKHPMGPFELLNFIGRETCDRILGNLFDEKKLYFWKKYYERQNR